MSVKNKLGNHGWTFFTKMSIIWWLLHFILHQRVSVGFTSTVIKQHLYRRNDIKTSVDKKLTNDCVFHVYRKSSWNNREEGTEHDNKLWSSTSSSSRCTATSSDPWWRGEELRCWLLWSIWVMKKTIWSFFLIAEYL